MNDNKTDSLWPWVLKCALLSIPIALFFYFACFRTSTIGVELAFFEAVNVSTLTLYASQYRHLLAKYRKKAAQKDAFVLLVYTALQMAVSFVFLNTVTVYYYDAAEIILLGVTWWLVRKILADNSSDNP